LIKIKIAPWPADTLAKDESIFSVELGRKMTRGDKLALVGVTIGWLLAGGLMTWAIYAFMVYILKYW
jgi:ABC-type cobalamin transport system permease subunit